ncbi:MAG TPA: methyltransferase domain-containing protein [Bacteroidales bacterium]|jgi:ubiquinone/menaquinone biosynthesis C-methylase UbiE|nr:methyltransferase domain-containing protein [Bacteroidales bacterium]
MKKHSSSGFDISFYAEVADECPLWSAPFGLKLLDRIDYRKNIKALDIGYGTGFPLTEIALRLGESSMVYGIDPWDEARERALKKISFFRINNITLLKGQAESIPLGDSFLELVTSNNGINNVDDTGKVISECYRVLKPGGQFIFTYNLDRTMFEFYDQLENALRESGMHHEIELMHRHIHEKRKPLDEMMQLVNAHGFTIKDMEHDQFNYRFADGSAMLNHYFIRLAFMDSWLRLLPADRSEEIFGMVEERLNNIAEMLKGISLSIPFVLINAYKN